MENIEFLIEQKIDLKHKITKAMQELKEWFNDKIDKVKDFFRQIVRKVNESLRHVKSDQKLSRDIKHDGEIIFKKGTLGSVYKNGVRTHVSELGINTNIVINDSKRGISYIANNDADRAMYVKTRVVETFKKVTAIGSITLALVASSKFIDKRKEKVQKRDTINNTFETMEKNKKQTIYDVDYRDKYANNIKKAFDDEDDISGGDVVLALS